MLSAHWQQRPINKTGMRLFWKQLKIMTVKHHGRTLKVLLRNQLYDSLIDKRVPLTQLPQLVGDRTLTLFVCPAPFGERACPGSSGQLRYSFYSFASLKIFYTIRRQGTWLASYSHAGFMILAYERGVGKAAEHAVSMAGLLSTLNYRKMNYKNKKYFGQLSL